MPIHGRKTKVFVNAFDLSRFFRNAEISGESTPIDTTTFDATARTFIPDYIEGGISLSGCWDADPYDAVNAPAGTASEVDDVLQPILGSESNQILTICQEGADAAGVNAQLAQGKETKYSVSAPTNNLVSVAAEVKADGAIKQGLLLAHKTARTATANGTSQDNAAATTTGAVAHLHVTDASGTTPTLDVVIEDSADNSSWATIGTFAQLAVEGSERISIAGTVRRYVRARWTIAGTTPSFTFIVALART